MRWKICCIDSPQAVALAAAAGADILGFVGPMPSGPGPIPLERIQALAPQVPPGVSRWLLTAETTLAPLLSLVDTAGCETLQLVDRVAPEVRRELRRARPWLRIVQVVHVVDEGSIAEARAAAEASDAVLLDSGRPDAQERTLGGTGETHDWSLSARIREALDSPVFLAGGLTPDNVASAVEQVRPAGVDVCSGLRIDGRLDPARVRAFAAALGRTAG